MDNSTKDKHVLESWFEKLFFTIISVKVWGLVLGTSISTTLLYKGYISGTAWVTFNTTIWGLIFGMKEIFKIQRNREESEQSLQKNQAIVQSELYQQKAMFEQQSFQQRAQHEHKQRLIQLATTQNLVDSEGREIVGEDSDI